MTHQQKHLLMNAISIFFPNRHTSCYNSAYKMAMNQQPDSFLKLDKMLKEIVQNPEQINDSQLESFLEELKLILTHEEFNGFLLSLGLKVSDGSGSASKGVSTVGKLCIGLTRTLIASYILHQSFKETLEAGAKVEAEINWKDIGLKFKIDASQKRDDAANTSAKPT